MLINTSGATSQPKFVVHTLDTLPASTDLLCMGLGLAEDDVIVAPVPMAHIGGLIFSLTFIQRGVPFVVMKSFDADAVLDNIERHRCTWIIGLPYQDAVLLEAQQASRETCLPCGSVLSERTCVRPTFRKELRQRSAHRFITSGEPRRSWAR